MSKKEIKSIDDCVPGLIVAQDIYKGASLVVPKNIPLDEHLISKLKEFGIETLAVYLPRTWRKDKGILKPIQEPYQEFKKQYRENVDTVKTVLHDLAGGRELELNKMETVFDTIYTQIADNYNLIDCINEVRSVDNYTYTHGINVSLYGGLIARWMGLPEEQIKDVIQAGILHDIGKAKIPREILNKKGPLAPEEMEQMKEHSLIGYKMVQFNKELNDQIKGTILMHHEREDGSGYPLGASGHDINIYTKIITVADVYDALTSERVYKKRTTPFDTFAELEKIGFAYFDTQVMLVFLSNIANYYTGAKVKMNTNEIGEIACVLPQSICTPMVVVGGKYIDLSQEENYRIVEML